MIIALMADKGGVGKTTAAHNLGAELCRHGSVLLIDADKQADLTELCGVASEPNIGSPLLAAAGLGLLGWGVGAVAGHAIQGDCFEEYCGLEGIFYGGAAGGGMGLAVGAHLGNRRRGSFPLDVLTSGAVWGVGYALMSSFANDGDGAGVVLTAIMLPPTQLVATVLVERATGHSRAGRLQAP